MTSIPFGNIGCSTDMCHFLESNDNNVSYKVIYVRFQDNLSVFLTKEHCQVEKQGKKKRYG